MSVGLPKSLVARSSFFYPRPREQVCAQKEMLRIRIGLGLPNRRVVERHIVVLGDHPSDQPLARMIADVPALEEVLLDHRYRVPHRREVGREAHRRVGDDVELLARCPGSNFGRAYLGEGPIYLPVNGQVPRIRTSIVSIRRDARSPTVYDLSA